MAESSPHFPVIREAVASFPDRQHFHRAVANLLAAGFDTSDLSVLATHDSLAVAGEPPEPAPKLLRQEGTSLIRKPFRMGELWRAVKKALVVR